MSQRRPVAAKKDGEDSVPYSKSLGPIVAGTGPFHLDEADSNREVAPLSIDERYEEERKNVKTRHWKESPFAVGLVEPSWSDEAKAMGCCSCCYKELIDPDMGGCSLCSSFLCTPLGAGRVGNLVVCRQSTEWVDEVNEDEETGEQTARRYARPKLDCIMGPYWPMLMCCTYPLIFGVSGWTMLTALPGKHPLIQLFWGIATGGLVYALAMTAFCDPGVLYKHEAPPPQDENSWSWNESAQTYKPRGAIYDPDCAVVVEDFDHTCPWTGTAIGRKNMTAFQTFVGLVFFCLILDILLLTGSLG